MAGSFAIAIGLFIAGKNGAQISATTTLLVTVFATTAIWIIAAFVGPKTDPKVLEKFYRLVRPAGPGWEDVRKATGLAASPDSLPQAMLGWVMGVLFVYASLFGMGAFLFGNNTLALAWLVVFVVSGAMVLKVLQGFWLSAKR